MINEQCDGGYTVTRAMGQMDQPADYDSVRDIGGSFELLDTAALFAALLEGCSFGNAKCLSHLGGLLMFLGGRRGPPPYANAGALRDPGNAVWARVFDELNRRAPATAGASLLSAERKGDMLELLLAAARLLLEGGEAVSSQLRACLSVLRVLVEARLRGARILRAPSKRSFGPILPGSFCSSAQTAFGLRPKPAPLAARWSSSAGATGLGPALSR